MSEAPATDLVMHTAAHNAWKSSVVTDPVTKATLAYVDKDRFQFSNFSMKDSHADVCLMDKLTRPALKDHSCQCNEYATWLKSHATDTGVRSLKAYNLKRLKTQ
jgi:hypothetical protein